MRYFNQKLFRKLASLAYSAGVVSIVIGILLSFVAQPVYASPANGQGNDKVWICHIPPGNPDNPLAISVDADGWNGHGDHAGDFEISGRDDPACSGSEPATASVTPTSQPTEIEETAFIPVTGEDATITPTVVDDAEKIWICHIPPGNPDNPLSIQVDEDGWSGHDDHAGDYEIAGPQDPACAAPTAVPTDEPTAVPTETPTETPTELPTSTPTATIVPFARLSLGYICLAPQQQWTVSNPNDSAMQIVWSLSSGGSGSGTVPASSSLSFYTGGGYHTMTISWQDNNGQPHNLSSTTSETNPCPPNEERTPPPPGDEPRPTRRATFVTALQSTPDPNQELLIPVTGADFSDPFTGTPLGSLFFKFGFVVLGFAFLTHGVSFKLKGQ